MSSSRPRPVRTRRTRRTRLIRAVAGALVGLCGAFALSSAPASADPSPSAWATLRTCESGGNYAIVSRSGTYRGAYQFDQGTWNSVGGTGSPDRATPAEQDYRALKLYRMRGWQPWTCARLRGLKEDADARSGRTPTTAEAARVGGHSLGTSSTGTGSSGAATWPGRDFTYGQCDPAIKTFQLQMNQRGYHYTFQGTGCYVTKTREAVRDVQLANGLTPRDRLDKATWTAAFSGVAAH